MDKIAELETAAAAQGELVRKLKSENSSEAGDAVTKLLQLKKDVQAAVEEQVAVQGNKVRELKEQGADKDALQPEIDVLLALKAKLPQKKEEKKKKPQQQEKKKDGPSKSELKKLERKKKKEAYMAAKAAAAAEGGGDQPPKDGATPPAKGDAKKGKSDQFGNNPPLKGADNLDRIVTRFPPEPSGHLHIGHAKAIFLNSYYADRYEGKLIVRFDDTNPSNEKEEYEHAIIADLQTLGVVPEEVTWTSDSFDLIQKYAERMIDEGIAYVDDTPIDQMREERMEGIASKNRELSVEDNKALWKEMVDGTKKGLECCLRAKVSVTNPNKCMRDPVIYRCNLAPHARTKSKYKVYPTYDLACPIVDSIEGVTHAMRDTQYSDREEQFNWFIKALKLREVLIHPFSRLNFNYTFLSKRKLAKLVANGFLNGWDDPRCPTMKGIIRRGLCVEALKQFMLSQGTSKRVVDMEWDKIWSINKKLIDPVSPRYFAISESNATPLTITNIDNEDTMMVPKHPKEDGRTGKLGMKAVFTAPTVVVEAEDANQMVEGEEVTLMRWGNVKITGLERDTEGKVTKVTGEFNPNGDFKATKLKIGWVAQTEHTVPVKLFEFDFLITKKKLEKSDVLEDFLNPVTEAHSMAVGNAGLRNCQVGDTIQLERRGFFRVDKAYGGDGPLHLFSIPDGKAKAMSSLTTQLAHR